MDSINDRKDELEKKFAWLNNSNSKNDRKDSLKYKITVENSDNNNLNENKLLTTDFFEKE